MPDKKLQDISKHIEQLDKVCSDNSVQISGLSGKVDAWQSTVESVLSTAQTSVNHSSYILTTLGIILALAIIWVSRNKKEAIKHAIDDVRDDIVKEVMNSKKFQNVLREAIAYKMQAESAEGSRATRGVSQSIALSNINSAEQNSSEENGEHNSEIYDKTHLSKKGGAI